MKYVEVINKSVTSFHEEDVSPVLNNCLSFTKLVTFPSLVLKITGFNLSCSNSPLKSFLSSVISK